VRSEFGMVPRDWRGKVKLDIGGEVFNTTVSELSSKGGLLAAVCLGLGGVQKDREGCVFFDRSPLMFSLVLNYLCDEPLHVGKLSQAQRALLQVEAEFYELDGLFELLGVENPHAVRQTPLAKVTLKNKGDLQGRSEEISLLANQFAKEAAIRQGQIEAQRAGYQRMLNKIQDFHTTDKIKLQLRSDRQVCAVDAVSLTEMISLVSWCS
jgi:hypothetical protein